MPYSQNSDVRVPLLGFVRIEFIFLLIGSQIVNFLDFKLTNFKLD